MKTTIKIKRKTKRKIYWAFALLFLFLLLFFLGDFFRSFFFKNTQTFQEGLFQRGKNFTTFLLNFSSDKTLKEENQKLKEENQKLLLQVLELEELKKENKVLREALNLQLQKKFKLKEAKIIARSSDAFSFFINKGKDDGIFEGMVVISPQKNLIGQVKKTYAKDSLVETIYSPKTKVSVFIGKENLLALAQGKGSSLLVSENVPKEKEIKVGDVVFSADLNRQIPKNLLIGKVVEIEKSDISPFQTLKIKPFFDFLNLDFVFVIIDF
ncbi:MAG: rod shape-determining protein MreC [Candidatus Pacebacteria bacterium]|nr:rod shape-determining protein MreC [Candidatus Paceibacterota bacterium]